MDAPSPPGHSTSDGVDEVEPGRPHDPHGVWALRLTLLSGILGAVVTAATALLIHRAGAPPGWAAISGIAAGTVVQVLMVPWRSHRAHRTFYRDLAALRAAVEEMRPSERREPLRRLPVQRDDELGELARAIRDVFAEAIAQRVGFRNMQRHLDHSIQRETDRAVAVLKREVLTDPLTGLGNRRGLDERLQQLFGPGGAPAIPVAALMIDLDRFKEINDTLGHAAGDMCLAFTAQVIRASLRADDYAARLGGDEFVAILVRTTRRDAEMIANRLMSLFIQQPWPHRHIPKPTLSIGVAATTPAEACGAEELLRQADSALYGAKRGGRSRVNGYSAGDAAA